MTYRKIAVLVILIVCAALPLHAQSRPAVAKKPAVKAVSLKGSAQSQIWQNQMAKADKLSPIQSRAQMLKFEQSKLLVRLPDTAVVKTDPRLKSDEAYCYVRPWTRDFLEDFGLEYFEEFHRVIQVNSGVRDVEHQKELRRTNSNAAAISGPKASSHLTGATVDIAKMNMSAAELAWVRTKLLALERQKKIEATEERKQLVFHVMIFRAYAAKK